VTGLEISPTAPITEERRANDAGADITFAVADSTKLDIGRTVGPVEPQCAVASRCKLAR
jgi:hypothetical protein